MKSDIFRKVSLERLSSPEQLDQILTVTSPKNWVALIAILVLLGIGVVWGFQGSIATTAPGQGLIVRAGGVLNVVAGSTGIITGMRVKVGDRIRRDQVIAQVAQPALVERIRSTDEAIAELERQREVARQIRGVSGKLQTEALARQRENTLREIKVLQDQAKIVGDQIPVEAELLAKGLITRQATFAAKQKLVDIEGQIAAQQAQLKQFDSQQYAIDSQPLQADIEMQSKIADQRRILAGLQRELELAANVISPYSGEVLELQATAGTTVAMGAPLITIQPDVDQIEVLVYVSAAKAKDIRPGMEAQVSPTTVRREEFGYLKATIRSIADYPATPAALMRNFQNETIVNSLLGSGPITEMHVSLVPDTATVSGYRWSSPKGPPVTLSSGTICAVQIVTQQQSPISLVIPFFKESLGLS